MNFKWHSSLFIFNWLSICKEYKLRTSLVVTVSFQITNDRKCHTEDLGSSAEQSQTSRSSSSPFVDIDLENMTDSGSNNQPGRSPKNKKSAISKFFIRLSLSKKQQNGLNTPLSEEPGTSKEGSTTMTHVNSSYDSVAHSDLSSESYYAAPRNSPVTSRDIPPDQSLQAKQHRLLRRLHSTLNEATVIVKEFCFVQA
ncbi:uncharacterized protein LOC141526043 isoform X2 [Cotesia typhae]|uniref:uncharacterized protein LOC141526043 isoform X2 n=1 Tax=Cotesia typhae TaxID=2053667 RepID=UPI003D681844